MGASGSKGDLNVAVLEQSGKQWRVLTGSGGQGQASGPLAKLDVTREQQKTIGGGGGAVQAVWSAVGNCGQQRGGNGLQMTALGRQWGRAGGSNGKQQ